jgi:hypothetical protein
MKLFGGPVAWRASKQHCVVTSSTEAELVALTTATREFMALIRLIEQLQVIPGPTGSAAKDPYILLCDNLQTLRLLTAEYPQLTSKLKHIDIQQLWIRQVYKARKLQFRWVSTNRMPADGMTKTLPPQRHAAFLQMLGLKPLPTSSLTDITDITVPA